MGTGNGVWVMRCHLMKDGHVHGVLLLDDSPREQLIEQAEAILREWAPWVTGVEVWNGASAIYRSSVPSLSIWQPTTAAHKQAASPLKPNRHPSG